MNVRPDWDAYFAGLARAVATRGDCRRRQVGCVIVDSDHRVISTGYNGAEPGGPSCLAGQCPRGLNVDAPRTEDYSNCVAIHAEANALLFARTSCKGATAYVTAKPCDGCAKLLRGAGVARTVVVAEDLAGVLFIPPEVVTSPSRTPAILRALIAQVAHDAKQPYWRERWVDSDDIRDLTDDAFPSEIVSWLSSLIDFGWEPLDGGFLGVLTEEMTRPLTSEGATPTDHLPSPLAEALDRWQQDAQEVYRRLLFKGDFYYTSAERTFAILEPTFPKVTLLGSEALRKFDEGVIDVNHWAYYDYPQWFADLEQAALKERAKREDDQLSIEAEKRVREVLEDDFNQHNGTFGTTNAEAARIAALTIAAIRGEGPKHNQLASNCNRREEGLASSTSEHCFVCYPEAWPSR